MKTNVARPNDFGWARVCGWVIAILAMVVAACIGFFLSSVAQAVGTSLASEIALRDAWVNITIGFSVGAGFLAASHVPACHPMFNEEYRTWLSRMPWRLGKPLPLGSTAPTLGHGVYLVCGPFLSHYFLPDVAQSLQLAALMLTSYLAGRAAIQVGTFFFAGLRVTPFGVLAALIGALYGCRLGAGWSLGVLLALQPGLIWADRAVWRRFPWSFNEEPSPRETAEANLLGVWPFGALAPFKQKPPYSRETLAGIALTVIWLAFTVATLAEHFAAPVLIFVGLCVLSYFAERLKCWFEMPVIENFRDDGQIWRYLDGYRGVFIAIGLSAPIAALGAAELLPPMILYPTLAATMLGPVFFAGPDAEVWRLTTPADLTASPERSKVEELT